ncbi:MAG: hypothetical protein ACRKGH_09530 [Dehalogenimonas sp.]
MKYLARLFLLLFSLSPLIAYTLSAIIVGNGTSDNRLLGIFIAFSVISIPISWIIYITNVFRNKTVAKNERTNWVLLLILGHIITFPFYWYKHIWHDITEEEQARENRNVSAPSPSKIELGYKWSKRSNKSKLLLLAISLSPILLFAVWGIILIYNPGNPLAYVTSAIIYVLIVGLVIYYVVDARINRRIGDNVRTLWIVLLVLGNIAVIPIYWAAYIWQKPKIDQKPLNSMPQRSQQ